MTASSVVLIFVAYLLAVEAPAGAAELKAPCTGLMTRRGMPSDRLPFIDSMVVNVKWSDLETADEVFDGPAWGEIDRALHTGRKVRLRILAGIHAPDFVKAIGGVALSDDEHALDASKTGGVAAWSKWDKTGGVTALFWLPGYLDQYEQLMWEVARRYEDVPELAEVVNSACMTIYAEVFYRGQRDTPSRARLLEAGLTLEKDLAAQRRAIEIHHAVFRTTRTSLAINAWDIISAPAEARLQAWQPTWEFARWARELMGEKLILQNNGFGPEAANLALRPPDEHHFGYLARIDPPKGFQTRAWSRLDKDPQKLIDVIENAIQMHANFIELPVADPDVLDFEAFSALDARLEQNWADFRAR